MTFMTGFVNYLSAGRLKWLIAAILMLVHPFSNAVTIKDVKVSHRQTFNFNLNARQGSALAGNEILQLLADGSGKLRVFTSYEFSCDVNIFIRMDENNQGSVAVSVENVAVSGDTLYRDFSMVSKLIPFLMDITILINDPNGRVMKEIVIRDLAWEEETESVHPISLPGNNATREVTAEVRHLNFHYGEDYTRQVTFYRDVFHAYYHSSDKINEAFDLLEGLTAMDHRSLILDEFSLCEAEVIAGAINQSAFLTFLPLHANDPELILERLDSLNTCIGILREDFNFAIAHVDSIFYHEATKKLQAADIAGARELLNRVVSYNLLHIPAHSALASLELQSGDHLAAMRRFERLMGSVPPPRKWQADAIEAVEMIFDYTNSIAEEAMDDGRFLDALTILNQTDSFCDTLVQWDCPARLRENLVKAHYGMYRSYLSVARRAYVSASFSFAVMYVENAREYQQTHAAFLADDSEALVLLQMILDGYYHFAEDAAERFDFAASVNYLSEAIELCRKNPSLVCRDDAATMLERVQAQKQYAERIIIPVVVAEPRIILSETTEQQVKQKVRDLLSRGHLMAWAGEVEEARGQLNELMTYVLRYDLRKDSLINMRIISLTEMISHKECQLAHQQFHDLLHQAERLFRGSFYMEATEKYDEAAAMIPLPQDCEEGAAGMPDTLFYIPLAGEYQRLLHAAQRAYFRTGQDGFEPFVRTYTEAGEFHARKGLEQWGVVHQSLFDFTRTSNNSFLVIHMVRYFADYAYPDNAFELLRLLKRQGFDPRELRELMEHSGKMAAQHIYQSTPALRASSYIHEKTGGDAWFRFYSRSFLRNWPG